MERKEAMVMNDALPTEMTIGGRTYELLGFLEAEEISVGGHEMISRAVKMNALLKEEDVEHILEHQEDIPAVLRWKVRFVFPDWRCSSRPSMRVYHLVWRDTRSLWVLDWEWLGRPKWGGYVRLLRRK